MHHGETINVLIIGARQGVGAALAMQYAEQYSYAEQSRTAPVASAGRVHATLRNLSDPGLVLRGLTPRIRLHELDVASDRQIEALARAFDEARARIHLLIHVAGVNQGSYEQQRRINSQGLFRVVDALMPSMMRSSSSNGRSICLVTSALGTSKFTKLFNARFGDRCDAVSECAYVKSKQHANDEFRRREPSWRAQGVTAILMQPGYVMTAMNNGSGRITAAQSAQGIRRLCTNLHHHPHRAGKFFDWQGKSVAW